MEDVAVTSLYLFRVNLTIHIDDRDLQCIISDLIRSSYRYSFLVYSYCSCIFVTFKTIIIPYTRCSSHYTCLLGV